MPDGPHRLAAVVDLLDLLELRNAVIAHTSSLAADSRPVQVDRDREQQEPRPPVDRVETQRLPIADQVEDQPDDEPENCHGATLREQAARRFALPRVGEELPQELGISTAQVDANRGEPLAPADRLAGFRPGVDRGQDSAITFMCSGSHWVAKIFPATRNEGRPW